MRYFWFIIFWCRVYVELFGDTVWRIDDKKNIRWSTSYYHICNTVILKYLISNTTERLRKQTFPGAFGAKQHFLVTKKQVLLFTLTQKVTKSSSHCSLALWPLLSYSTIACGTRGFTAQTVLGFGRLCKWHTLSHGASKVTD